ncbi:hypothetical protein WSM22_34410 [Cytophagales bacterium WSM2-2]|nr:hypothetical protein WSM22_34410 [Cytophagales bacterium WSM2-2]
MRLLCLIAVVLLGNNSVAQITGKWTSLDDNSGEPRSVIEITERNNKFYGKVVKIHSKAGEDPDPVCDKCEQSDPRFKQKVISMEILKELAKDGNEFSGGHILDPENGKVYRCKLWVDGKDLKVRGYWGPFFRTQTWKREAVQP